jgi:hypothetical protein
MSPNDDDLQMEVRDEKFDIPIGILCLLNCLPAGSVEAIGKLAFKLWGVDTSGASLTNRRLP